MSKDTIDKTLDFIFQSPNKNITIEFQGGETLLRVDLFKYIVKKAKKLNKIHNKNLHFALVSNLTLMTDELLDWIRKERVNICTSLDGPKELHDKNRWFEGGGANYDEVTHWIKKIKEKTGRPPGMLMVTTKYSIPLWKEIVDEYIKWGHNSLQLKHMNKIGFAEISWKQIGYTMDEFFDFWKKSVDYMIELNKEGIKIKERFVGLILQKILTKQDPNFVDWKNPTGEIIGAMAYDHNGDIFASDEGRMNDLFKLGNVHTDTYKEIVSSEKSQQLLGASINDNYAICDACAYKPWCGLDPVVIHAEQGSIIPKVSDWSRHKLYEFQFNYVFDKLLFDDSARDVFFDWLGGWRVRNNTKEDIERVIINNYGVDIGGIEKIKDGVMNKFIFIKNNKQKRLFKIYYNWFKNEKENEDFISSVTDWISFLRKKGIEIGSIKNTKDGKGYLKMQNNFAVLHDYIEGESFKGTKKEIKNSAKKLAHIHNLLRGYKKEMHTRKFRKNIGRNKKLLKHFFSRYPETFMFFGEIENKLEKMNKELKEENYSKLEKLYIHGDFKADNLVYENKKVKAIIDFDSIMYGPKIFDLAVFLVSLIVRCKKNKINMMNVFYNEYKKSGVLNKTERQMMLVFMKLRLIKQMISRLKNQGDKKKEIIELMDCFNWVEENDGKIEKIFKLEG